MFDTIELGTQNQNVVQKYQAKLSELNETVKFQISRKKVEELNQEINFLKEALDRQYQGQKAFKRKTTETKDKLQTEVLSYQQQLQDIKSELERLQRDKKKKLVEFKDLNHDVSLYEIQIEEYQQAQEQGQNVNTDKSRQQILDKYEKDINEAKNFRETLEKELKATQQQSQQLKQQIAIQAKKKETQIYTQEDKNKWVKEIDQAHENFLNLRDEIVKLNKNISDIKLEINRQEQLKESGILELQKKNDEFNKLKNQKKSLEHQIEVHQKNINDLTKLFKNIYQINDVSTFKFKQKEQQLINKLLGVQEQKQINQIAQNNNKEIAQVSDKNQHKQEEQSQVNQMNSTPVQIQVTQRQQQKVEENIKPKPAAASNQVKQFEQKQPNSTQILSMGDLINSTQALQQLNKFQEQKPQNSTPVKVAQPSISIPVTVNKQNNQKIKEQASQNIKLAIQSHGQLDICFLLDVTNSMDKYKEQTIKSISKTVSVIQQTSNREVNFAAVCYQDFQEKHEQGGSYQQFEFSKNSNTLELWLQGVECKGGGDTAEDIRGAIKQMCQLNWQSKFRICILICDSPCHGQQFNGGCQDQYQNEDINDALLELIQKKITLIGLNFNKSTIRMFQEIRGIYYKQDQPELFLYIDCQDQKIEELASNIAKYLGEACGIATQINESKTKLNRAINQPEQVGREGAVEALCKKGNFENFQDEVKTIDVKFQVFRIELKDQVLQKKEEINKIRVPEDFDCRDEGKWNCIRTESPFASGAMKDVYLMKKTLNNYGELYVIKAPKGGKPYQSREVALKECRSHLFCSKLMQKFQSELQNQSLQQNLGKKFPEIIYTNFLILQESPNQFWIAERFFQGDFIKYNNNFGYINDQLSDYNKMAQAFSYYTYLNSEFNYMICDIQGVGQYFTDPAINTIEGNFDDSDQGEDGISMFLVAFEQKKAILAKEILDILKMNDEY